MAILKKRKEKTGSRVSIILMSLCSFSAVTAEDCGCVFVAKLIDPLTVNLFLLLQFFLKLKKKTNTTRQKKKN